MWQEVNQFESRAEALRRFGRQTATWMRRDRLMCTPQGAAALDPEDNRHERRWAARCTPGVQRGVQAALQQGAAAIRWALSPAVPPICT